MGTVFWCRFQRFKWIIFHNNLHWHRWATVYQPLANLSWGAENSTRLTVAGSKISSCAVQIFDHRFLEIRSQKGEVQILGNVQITDVTSCKPLHFPMTLTSKWAVGRRRSHSTVLISIHSAALRCSGRLGTRHGHIFFRCANWDHVFCPPKV